MSEDPLWEPVARSPLPVPEPVEIRFGWQVSAVRSSAPLRLADRTPLAKVYLRASPGGRVAHGLGVPFGRSRRTTIGTLVIGSGPDEWLIIAAPGTAAGVAARIDRTDEGFVTVLDLTHGRALMRLSGPAAAETLAKVCPIDLSDPVTPDHAAFRSSVARVATDVVRDDVAGTRSYLLHCERSSGRYLFESVLDAGREFKIEPDGFAYPEA